MFYRTSRKRFWQLPCDIRVVPVNSAGSGPAAKVLLNNKQAMVVSWRWPSFGWQVALQERTNGLKPLHFEQQSLISFPIRYDSSQETVSLSLIEKSAMHLAELLERREWQSVLLPLGDLAGGDERMERCVREIVALHLDRACVVLVEGEKELIA